MQDDLAGLIERCRELVAWSKKGVLVGDAIRTLASEKFGDPIYDHDRIGQAEKLTTKEALAFIANDLETLTSERDEARAEVEQEAALRVGAIERMKAAEAERDTLRTQLTATQARLEEAVELLGHIVGALAVLRNMCRTVNLSLGAAKAFELHESIRTFLAQQEGQSNG